MVYAKGFVFRYSRPEYVFVSISLKLRGHDMFEVAELRTISEEMKGFNIVPIER